MLIFQLVFAAIFISMVLAIILIGTRRYEHRYVPESVFERVVSWHDEIMANSQSDHTLVQLQEWRDFVLHIPAPNQQNTNKAGVLQHFPSPPTQATHTEQSP